MNVFDQHQNRLVRRSCLGQSTQRPDLFFAQRRRIDTPQRRVDFTPQRTNPALHRFVVDRAELSEEVTPHTSTARASVGRVGGTHNECVAADPLN